jgi:CBS domain containing-hemolysin-like protein
LIAIAIVLMLVTIPVAIVESGLRRALQADLAESWGFLRIVMTALFALVVGQALAPSGYLWWVNVIVAVVLTLVMVFTTQLMAKWLSQGKFGQALMKSLEPAVKQINLLFTPISGPKIDEYEEFEQELIDSVEDFTETIAREIMVPRIDIAAVNADDDLATAMRTFLRTGYSRLPVEGKSVDEILGVLYLKDVSRILFEDPGKRALKTTSVMRKAIFIPESKPVDDLLKDMQTTETHIAIIIDEYGGVAGLATMEDVIEEIVGEISDEFDREIPDVQDLGEKRFLVNARYSLEELGELYDIELDDEDVDSVGGLIAKELGRLAVNGDKVTYSGLILTVHRIEQRRKRILSVLVEPTSELSDAESAFENEDKRV